MSVLIYFLVAVFALLLVIALWIGWGTLQSQFFPQAGLPLPPYGDEQSRKYAFELAANYGSAFGSLNTLFAGLAAALTLIVLLHQIHISYTMSKRMEQESLERQFVFLLDRHDRLVEQIETTRAVHSEPITFSGRRAIWAILDPLGLMTGEQAVREFSSSYEFVEHGFMAGYFRSVIALLRFLDGYDRPEEDKQFFARLFGETLTDHEKYGLMIYACTNLRGAKELKRYIEKFGLLAGAVLTGEERAAQWHLSSKFDERAFGDGQNIREARRYAEWITKNVSNTRA